MTQTKLLITGATARRAATQHGSYSRNNTRCGCSPIGLTNDRSNCRSFALRSCSGTSSISTLCVPR